MAEQPDISLMERHSVARLNFVFGFEKVDQWNPIITSAIQSRYHPMRFPGFYSHEKEGSSRIRNFEVINGLQQVFKKYVELSVMCLDKVITVGSFVGQNPTFLYAESDNFEIQTKKKIDLVRRHVSEYMDPRSGNKVGSKQCHGVHLYDNDYSFESTSLAVHITVPQFMRLLQL
jgi:hypothetical protein